MPKSKAAVQGRFCSTDKSASAPVDASDAAANWTPGDDPVNAFDPNCRKSDAEIRYNPPDSVSNGRKDAVTLFDLRG
jgi:hypothetical protein